MGRLKSVRRFYDTGTLRGRHRLLKTIAILLVALMVIGGYHGYTDGGASEVLTGAFYFLIFGIALAVSGVAVVAIVLVLFALVVLALFDIIDWAKGTDL